MLCLPNIICRNDGKADKLLKHFFRFVLGFLAERTLYGRELSVTYVLWLNGAS